MRLVISDAEKLTSYDLPEKINESFLFSYTPKLTNIETFLGIFAENGKWCFKNDESISISDNSEGNTILEINNVYKLNIKGANYTYYLYTVPVYYEKFVVLTFENIPDISIGSATNCDISFSNLDIVKPLHAKLINLNGIWSIESGDNNVYINGRTVEKKQLLEVGDRIFIAGVTLIWMKNFVKVCNSKQDLKVSQKLKIIPDTLKNDNSKFIRTDIENDVSIYSDSDYFFHKPRLRLVNDVEEVIIENPPTLIESEDVPFLLSLGTSLSFGVYGFINLYKSISAMINNTGDQSTVTLQLITAIVSITSSFIMPKILKSYSKKRTIQKNAKQKTNFNFYLDKKYSMVSASLTKQTQNLFDSNPSAKECFEDLIGNKRKLWERRIEDSDFLTIRVGIGDVKSSLEVQANTSDFNLDEEELSKKIRLIVEKSMYLKNVPITYSLSTNIVSAIICKSELLKRYIDGIITQLVTLQSPKELKIVFLTNKDNSHKWNYIKMLSNCMNFDSSVRYYAETEEEAKKIIQDIEFLYSERVQELSDKDEEINKEINDEVLYSNFNTYYLIITDNFKEYKNIKFINELLNFNKNLGFSFLIIDDNMRNVPNECAKYVYVAEKDSCIFEKNYSKQTQVNFITEIDKELDMNRISKVLYNIPVQSSDDLFSLPQVISFLEMYNVGRIEQLNLLNKWNTSNPVISLQAPIGVGTTGDLFKLDLHEKSHGPHGLIAGSTGSGKSEFIITYILSMAINYDPREVQFVLIDYKGGGLAGAFENREKNISIPHLAGTITNLDTAEMNRTLVSIRSELKRRQVKFNEARDSLGESTIDIYKYQRFYREGLLKEPISHLFIISDEFAELKAQQPEFMDELISISRIGRSLGVHLILATQKPAGVVNDQIWSNSRFKVCLKVQTRSDSQEMLKRPEAASIRETGRFYLQVGYDELFELGQSAWAGAKYNPADKIIKKVDDSIMFIDNVGDIIKTTNNMIVGDVKTNEGDQLTSIVKYICNVAKENNYFPKKLWLDNIPPEIYLGNLQKKYGYTATQYQINPIIGEYDNPEGQTQGLLTLDLTNKGNTLIYGMQGSGKENLLTTIISSCSLFHSPDEVNFYIIDFGSESLRMFKDFPQVGDVILADNQEKMSNFIVTISNEIRIRKDLFANYMGSYNNYIKESGKKLPLIVCIINQYDNLSEYSSSVTDTLTPMIKEGNKYGVIFIINTTNPSSVRSRTAQLFNYKICMQLADKTEYRYLIDADRGQIPSSYFGRGIINLGKCYEFQTAYTTRKDNISVEIRQLATKLNEAYKGKKAPEVLVMPDYFLASKLKGQIPDLSDIPVGISRSNLSIVKYNFNTYKITPILANSISDHLPFIYGLVEVLKNVNNVKIRVIDALKVFNKSLNVDVFNEDFDLLVKQLRIEQNKDKEMKRVSLFVIIGLGEFKNKLNEENLKVFNNVMESATKYQHNRYIVFDNYASFKFLENEFWFRGVINQNNGMWLGENASTQLAIRMPNLSMGDRKTYFSNIGYVVKESQHTIVRYVVDSEGDKNEE